ncbi:YjzD family protein, partial [Enterococcus faecium]|uniref:YjzD family protein n=1 Tax=Enterococcus faecium TaxID=1352 RepID=UPI00292E03DF
WAVVLGQVVGYIGAALTSGTYDFTLTTIISFIAGVIILLIGALCYGNSKCDASSYFL